VLVAVNSHAEEPMPASIWHALAGSPLTEDPRVARRSVCLDERHPQTNRSVSFRFL